MFTGIIEEMGIIRSLGRDGLEVSAQKTLEGTQLGDSIAVEGVCLTVTKIEQNWFKVNLMPETLRRTNFGQLRPGDPVNLERALTLNSRLGGHLVQGHIDGVGKIANKRPEVDAILVNIAAPEELLRYVVEKGFIALDGASLTVTEVNSRSFGVSLVPYTQSMITLTSKRLGDEVNLEVDILAKYVEKLTGNSRTGLTQDFLAAHGFGG
jgi:riboflavin synthase